MSADYFKIRLTNAITNGIPVTTILGDPQFYGLITRGPNDPSGLAGRITTIQQTYINLGDTHIEGWDLEAHYKWPRQSWGRVALRPGRHVLHPLRQPEPGRQLHRQCRATRSARWSSA